MRFASHRDIARAFERAVRRAAVPIAYSQGFTPHPKISYASAAPTGVASEAEYLELGLREVIVDVERLRTTLDAALSPGLDVVAAVAAVGGSSLAERIDGSLWRVELPGVAYPELVAAVAAFVAAPQVIVERVTKQGRRQFDARAAVLRADPLEQAGCPGSADLGQRVGGAPGEVAPGVGDRAPCAILNLVVRQGTPSVRPDDVLAGLRVVADLEPPVPPRVTRLAQGKLTVLGEIVDPLHAGDASFIGEPSG